MVHFQHLYNKQEIKEVLYICFSENAVVKSYSSNLVSFESSLESIKIIKGINVAPITLKEVRKFGILIILHYNSSNHNY